MNNSISIQAFTGDAILPYINELARLRIKVFRDFPYLYDGDMEYESKYLLTYIKHPDSVVVIACDGKNVIGASTGIPLKYEKPEIKQPFIENMLDPADIFYFGESVLHSNYRGQGFGVRFFHEREAHAQRVGQFKHYAFCAVERPANHPRRPKDYVPLNQFWNNRGYFKQAKLRTTMKWKDIDESSESPKPMVFWLKSVESKAAHTFAPLHTL